MIAHKFQYKDRSITDTISILQATPEHGEQIQALAAAAYHVSPDLAQEWFGADQYRSRMQHFPEGQSVALDSATGAIVGVTSSMRFQFSPEATFLENWDRTTGYG